jgi:hypothetical protein
MAPLLVSRRGGSIAESFLLGVLSSIPFDWASRRWVELHLTFELLSSLPVPNFDLSNEAASRVVQIAGTLAAVDARYADWAAEVGVSVATELNEAERTELLSELDALVSLLYGLSAEHVAHVFATFRRGWDYQPRLDAVLCHYADWKDRA